MDTATSSAVNSQQRNAIANLVDSYAQTVTISEKQHHYLCILLEQASDDAIAEINTFLSSSNVLQQTVEELLSVPYEEIKLSYYQVRTIINKLHRSKAASEKQVALVKSNFTLEQISSIFHHEFINYEELTHGQVQTLLKSSHKFTFRMKDYPLQIHPEYEFGLQETSGADCGYIFYLKFYKFLMLDFDREESVTSADFLMQIKEKLQTGPPLLWALYETPRGCHAFLMSTPLPHNEPIADSIAYHYQSDHFYRLSSFKNGYRVRLSKKCDEEEYVARFIEYVSTEYTGDENITISPECEYYKKVHDDILSLYESSNAAEAFEAMNAEGTITLSSHPDCYYKSWLSLLADDMEMAHQELTKPGFRKYVRDEMGDTVETVKLLAPALKIGMHKPQRLLRDCTEFYIAIDMLTNTYYICYKNLLMLDLDFYKEVSTKSKTDEEETKEEFMTRRREEIIIQITALTVERPELTFRLYSSQGGVHAFLTSRRGNRHDDADLQLMLNQGVDFNYVVYSYLRGWSVRLNRKRKEAETDTPNNSIYEYMCTIGTAEEDDKMVEQVRLHELLAKKYFQVKHSLMYGG